MKPVRLRTGVGRWLIQLIGELAEGSISLWVVVYLLRAGNSERGLWGPVRLRGVQEANGISGLTIQVGSSGERGWDRDGGVGE